MRTPQQTGVFCPPLKGAVAERPGDVLFGKQPGRHPPPLRGTCLRQEATARHAPFEGGQNAAHLSGSRHGDGIGVRFPEGVSSATSDTWVHAYNDANEQTSTTLNGGTPETRTYDSWGRLATRAQGTYSATYGYRYGGRLYNFTSNFPGEAAATFEYRGDGRLHRRTVGTDIKVYRYDAGWNAINTEDNSGVLQAASVYEPGQEVGQRLAYSYGSLGTGTVVYAYHDQLGSTRRWRLNKSSLGANEYEPYGEAYAVSTLAPRDYALHEWDPAIAAYRAPYRNYSPAMARWTTRDPLGMVDGPNMYGYVGGRTINSYDPLGLITESDCYKNFKQCNANSQNVFHSFMNTLGPLSYLSHMVSFGGTIGGLVRMSRGLIPTPIQLAAGAAGGLIDIYFILDIRTMMDREKETCKSMLEVCLRHAKC